MDHIDRFGVAKTRAHLFEQVVQGVLRFGEDDQLSAVLGRVDHQIIVEDAVELAPFRVHAGTQHAKRHGFEAFQRLDLKSELLHSLGGRRTGGDQVLELVDFLLPIFLDVAQDVCIDRPLVETCPATLRSKARLAELAFQTLAAALQRLVDCGRRRRQAALEDLQGEANIVPLLAVALGKTLHAVHLCPHVLSHRRIKRGLTLGELILDSVGPTLGKQRSAIECKQFLLGQPPHHVFCIGIMDAIAEPALETVTVKQSHEELEVFFLAVVRCRRHQQQVAAGLAELLADLVALGVFHFTAEIGGRHAMRFVADDQVPFLRAHELVLELFIARQDVETHDQPVAVGERIAGSRRLDHVAREDVEFQIELLAELVLPLLDQAARCDDEAPFEIAARDQFLDEKASHDRLARAGIVGEEEAQRLTGQHLAIDGRNLMRQRID